MGYTIFFTFLNKFTDEQKGNFVKVIQVKWDKHDKKYDDKYKKDGIFILSSDYVPAPLGPLIDYHQGKIYGFSETTDDYIKWYHVDEDVLWLSKKFPQILFIAKVQGELPDDLTKRYYQNGKMTITKGKKVEVYEDFVPEKMKSKLTNK